MPDALIPDDLKGRLIVNNYTKSLEDRVAAGKDVPKEFRPSFFERQILRTPGAVQSMYKYLNGRGSKYIPKIVGYQLGDQWYTGAAKLFSRTPFGRAMVIDKMLDKTLPRINGDNSLAKQFLYAGGMV